MNSVKTFTPVEVKFDNNPLHNPPAPEFSRVIATVDEDGWFSVNVTSIYQDDCVDLLAAIAYEIGQLTEQDSEELLKKTRKTLRWNRRAERVKGFGLAGA